MTKLTPTEQVTEMKAHPAFESFLSEYASWLEEFHAGDIEAELDSMFLLLMKSDVELSPARRNSLASAYEGMKAMLCVRQSFMTDLSFAQN